MTTKVLYGCVACNYCANRVEPSAIGVLTSKDMTTLNYGGCVELGGNRLVNASRKCNTYSALGGKG